MLILNTFRIVEENQDVGCFAFRFLLIVSVNPRTMHNFVYWIIVCLLCFWDSQTSYGFLYHLTNSTITELLVAKLI